MAHLLIAEARFYAHLNDMLLAGARHAIEAAGQPSMRAAAQRISARMADEDGPGTAVRVLEASVGRRRRHQLQ